MQRKERMTTVSLYVNPSLKLLLTGDLTLSPDIYNTITLKVQKYIIDTHRFFLNTIIINVLTYATCSSRKAIAEIRLPQVACAPSLFS